MCRSVRNYLRKKSKFFIVLTRISLFGEFYLTEEEPSVFDKVLELLNIVAAEFMKLNETLALIEEDLNASVVVEFEVADNLTKILSETIHVSVDVENIAKLQQKIVESSKPKEAEKEEFKFE